MDERKAEFQGTNVRVPMPGTPETDGQAATATVPKRPRKSLVREYGEAIVIAVLLALVIRTLVVQAFTIPSGSMMDTLLVGDYIDRWSRQSAAVATATVMAVAGTGWGPSTSPDVGSSSSRSSSPNRRLMSTVGSGRVAGR